MLKTFFEEPDSPGEWYFDSGQGNFVLHASSGVDLRHAKVEAPALEDLVEFRGSQQDPVKHVNALRFPDGPHRQHFPETV